MILRRKIKINHRQSFEKFRTPYIIYNLEHKFIFFARKLAFYKNNPYIYDLNYSKIERVFA